MYDPAKKVNAYRNILYTCKNCSAMKRRDKFAVLKGYQGICKPCYKHMGPDAAKLNEPFGKA